MNLIFMMLLIFIILLYFKLKVKNIPNSFFLINILFVLTCLVIYGSNKKEYFNSEENKTSDSLLVNSHYYLIDAVKHDDDKFIDKHCKINNKKKFDLLINDVLQFDSETQNTLAHYISYYGTPNCGNYLKRILKTQKKPITYPKNKEGNNIIHISCLKGNYDLVYHLIDTLSENSKNKKSTNVNTKSENSKNKKSTIVNTESENSKNKKSTIVNTESKKSSPETTNNHGDTILHCAVRSGSFNCVKIILDKFNNLTKIKNNYGETPLHTAMHPVRIETELEKTDEIKDRMNLHIVKILVKKDEDTLKETNKQDESLLETLSKKPKSLVAEEIRTFLQRQYYEILGASSEYKNYLKNDRYAIPFDMGEYDKDGNFIFPKNIDLEKKLKEIEILYSDDIKDKNLYTEKRVTQKNKYMPFNP